MSVPQNEHGDYGVTSRSQEVFQERPRARQIPRRTIAVRERIGSLVS